MCVLMQSLFFSFYTNTLYKESLISFQLIHIALNVIRFCDVPALLKLMNQKPYGKLHKNIFFLSSSNYNNCCGNNKRQSPNVCMSSSR